jgi:Flp pilus assembly protein TadD
MSDDAEALFGQALADHQAGRLTQAVDGYRAVNAIRPGVAGCHGNLGQALAALEYWEEAIEAFETALALDRRQAVAYIGLMNILYRLGRYAHAETLCWQMIEEFPEEPAGYVNLGAILSRTHRFDAAWHALRQAPAATENDAFFQRNLGGVLSGLGARGVEGAIAAHRKSVALDPDNSLAHLGLAEALLRGGQLPEGWDEYRSVLRLPPLPGQEWNGEAIAGRSLLIHKDEGFGGGFGDVIHLSRYVSMASALGARVTFAVPPSQIALMQSLGPDITLVPVGSPMPDCDFHCSLMALPRLFRTDLGSIPAPLGYLHPPPDRAADWAERLSPLSGLRVGLIWAGHKYTTESGADLDDPRRIGLSPLIGLWREPGIDFVTLQLGDAARDKALLPEGTTLHDFTDRIGDFADTAAAMASLDLVISVDTSGAHLAAALGKPTWIVLASSCCWRWMYDRADSPWYPSVRLFRQKGPGEWSGVVEALRRRLRAAAQDRSALLIP